MKGDKPISNALKKSRGTYRPDRDTSTHIPQPDKDRAAVIRCPGHLAKEAKKEWKRIAGVLYDAGILTDLDRTALEAYCAWVAIHQQAIAEIMSDGACVKTGTGSVKSHPSVKLAKDAIVQVRLLGEQFGLTPAARGRVGLEVTPPEPAKPKGGFGELDELYG